MQGRHLYSFACFVFAVATLAMAMIVFFGSFDKALLSVYFVRLDMRNIDAQGLVSGSNDGTISGLYPLYQIGVNTECYGVYDNDTDADFNQCSTFVTPYYFSLRSVIWEGADVAGISRDSINIPSTLTDYEHALKAGGSAVWVLLIIIMVCSIVMAVLGICSAWSRVLRVGLFVLSILDSICAVACAAVATSLYKSYRDKINDTTNQFGVTASLGTSAFGLLWAMVVVALLATILWTITICLGGARKKSRNNGPTEKHDFPQTTAHY